MPNAYKANVLAALTKKFGDVRKMKGSKSLFVIGNDAAYVYFRYSKAHSGGRSFFGLRAADLSLLAGHNAFLCFLLDDGSQPLFLPYGDFEEVFHNAQPAKDGQYKVQLIRGHDIREIYVARKGRFNVEGYIGFGGLESSIDRARLREARTFSHCQIQTLLAGIGRIKGYDVWIPSHDVSKLDWTLTDQFRLSPAIPSGFEQVETILREIDVVWLGKASNRIEGVYEVEHSTPVYSGLLRFNDVLLTSPEVSRFSIVSDDIRRDVFSRQLFRPTFRKSGLSEVCSFLEYENVYEWHRRLSGRDQG